ncbi:MAG: hypothetical protein ACKOYJ_01590 [Planctomycetia bacterium]
MPHRATAAVLMLVALAVGCAREPIEHTVRKVPADTSEDDRQTKDEFEGMLSAGLEKLEEEVRELRLKARSLEQSAREKWAEELAELDARQKAAREKLEDVARSSGEAWQSLRDGATNAWKEFEKAVRKARSTF